MCICMGMGMDTDTDIDVDMDMDTRMWSVHSHFTCPCTRACVRVQERGAGEEFSKAACSGRAIVDAIGAVLP